MWFILALLVAVFTAAQDILNKKAAGNVDHYVVTWVWWTFPIPLILLFCFVEGWPVIQPGFYTALIIETPLIVTAVLFYIKALKSGDLSLSTPMLTFTPLLLLITSHLMLNERPSVLGMFGVVLIVSGSYILFLSNSQKGWLQPIKSLLTNPGSKYMFIVACLFSITCNLDKIGVISSSPSFWILSVAVVNSFCLFLIMIKKSKNVVKDIRSHFTLFLFISFCTAGALICQMIAIQMTTVPYLISVKRTSVILASLYGFAILKEEGIKKRMVGILIMIVGVNFILFS